MSLIFERVSPQDILVEAGNILNRPLHGRARNRIFRAFFGVPSEICSRIWIMLIGKHSHDAHPRHLLMALHFLKGYSTENVNATLFQVDEKTFRRWQWEYTSLIANLCVVS